MSDSRSNDRHARALTPTGDVAFREVAGEGVLLHMRTGRYYGMNAVATRAWMLLAAGETLASVRQTLAEEYDVEAPVLARDLDVWLAQLVSQGFLQDR